MPLIPWARITLVLGALLLLSVAGNLWQFRRAARARAAADAAALSQALSQAQALSRALSHDAAQRQADLDALIERGRQTRVVYRQAARVPLPANCAPDDARVQAINAGLGPSP